jgi:hypothetical protein
MRKVVRKMRRLRVQKIRAKGKGMLAAKILREGSSEAK